jgi:transposase
MIRPREHRRYPSDLTDREWEILEPLLPTPERPGRPRVHPLREILNAIFYELRSGCAWRMLPKDFPAWQTVYHYFRRWKRDGTWERIHTVLRERTRQRAGRTGTPSAAIVDSQSVRTSTKGGSEATTGANE